MYRHSKSVYLPIANMCFKNVVYIMSTVMLLYYYTLSMLNFDQHLHFKREMEAAGSFTTPTAKDFHQKWKNN